MSERLVRKRGYARAALTRVENAVNTFTSNTVDQDAIVQLELLEKAYTEFKTLDESLQDIDESWSELEEFEKRYTKIKSKLLTIINVKSPVISKMQSTLNETMNRLSTQQEEFFSSIKDSSHSMSGSAKDEIKLPRINIPPFNGTYSDFPSFRDLFETTIHNNANISEIHKLQLLKGLLKDKAAELVKNMSIMEGNYNQVWEKLIKRYERKGPVMTSLIKQFFEISPANDSVSSLRNIADKGDQIIRGLKVLGNNAELRDPWLIYIILNKLNSDTREQWALKMVDEEFPTFEQLLQFLETRCSALEVCNLNRKSSTPTSSSRNNTSLKSFFTTTSSHSENSQRKSSPLKCPKCEDSHHLSNCTAFKSLSISDKKSYVASNKICFNCLFIGHLSKFCKSKRRCFNCQRKHHTSLHDESENIPHSSPQLTHESQFVDLSVQSNLSICANPILPTALVKVLDRNNRPQFCRVLLDSGSTSSLISETCMNKLKLPRSNARFPVKGIAMKHSTTQGCTELKIMPHFSSDFSLTVKAYILDKLTSEIPRISCDAFSQWNELENLQLADKNEWSGVIDIILGVSQFLKILREGQLIGPDGITAQNTTLGWIIGGGEQNVIHHVSMGIQVDFNIDQSLQKFWEIEEIHSEQPLLTPTEQQAEDHFTSTHTRDSNGRFVVRLPLKSNELKFGNSLKQAQSRFFSIERKLNRDPHLKSEYCAFMQEYIDLGHMVPLMPADHLIPEHRHFYLPHHPVVKEANLTTKVRVVFDGSARSTTDVSLNQNLLIGFPVQPDLISTIMRFRLHKIAVTSDVAKMYRQIKMHTEDANYQRIVWRDNPTLPLQHYKLVTVTYGTSSAPFQATRCLKQLAMEHEENKSSSALVIAEDFYVDDLLTGADTVELAIELCRDVIGILDSAGLSLRKWASNSTELLNALPHSNDKTFIVDLMKPDHKILGVSWDPVQDNLSFKINVQTSIPTQTKRNLLSEASKLFDPLGWLAPVTISIKILFQQVWIIHLDWDDALTENISERWVKIRNDLPLLEQITIPRYMSTSKHHLQVHGFCDASHHAYAAVIYCRSVDNYGNVTVNIITSKTRVAPIKTLSIPRLELCGAHLLAKLMKVVLKNLKLSNGELFMWSDSQIVLQWLGQHPSSWKSFIANRTSEILTILPNVKWSHVPSAQNPADCASRGILPHELLHHDLWWHGPQWLTKSMEFWPPQTPIKIDRESEELESRKILINHALIEYDVVEHLIQRISSYSTIKRVLAYVLKFIAKLKCSKENWSEIDSTFVTTSELKSAENLCIKWAQQLDFAQELRDLSAGRMIKKGKLSALTPFLDENAIIRVGGRLNNSQCSYWSKHPAILPHSNVLSQLILSYLHKLYHHPGPSLLTHLSRQSYWIINVRKLSRQITNKCLICHRLSSKASTQLMGQLPAERVTPSKPFTQTALDYAGPIQIASKKGRGAKHLKAYICVFVCMTVKAIHLEAVTDLTADAFIAALKRFVSRRGLPHKIVCDNGTNFVGARRKLNDDQRQIQLSIQNNEVSAYVVNQGIEFCFSPPSAPHFNGLSEAAVRAVKHHLIRSLGQSHFTFEELTTFLCQTEAILNSRPLIPMSGDVEDINVLTPSHFLTTGPLFAVPELMYHDVSDNRLTRWQEIKKRVDCFWSRYKKEYLNNLHQRGKWDISKDNMKIGDVVYIKENTPPLSWPIGIIINVHPGDDGLVRVATVKTASNTVKRPIVKLVKLPTEDNHQSDHHSM